MGDLDAVQKYSFIGLFMVPGLLCRSLSNYGSNLNLKIKIPPHVTLDERCRCL